MATVRKPIALNETFKTTESTPRNLADVLAQALQALNTTISGLNFINCVVVQTLPTADISTTTIYLVPKNPSQTDNLYDEYINLTGTSAGWEKIGDTEIDLSDYYNKTETDTLLSGKVDKVDGKGLSTNDYTDADKIKLAGIEAGAEVNPTSSAKTATDTFTTVDGGLLSKCQINLVPVQSGSGDPYPAGGGKNKLPLVLADIKSANTEGTWSGNTYSYSDISFTVNTDSANNVISITINGTTSGVRYLVLDYNFDTTAHSGEIFNGLTSDTNITCRISNQGDNTSLQELYNNSTILDVGTSKKISVRITSTTANNVVIYPMLRLSTVTDPTFAPYSNICPISGHTEVDLHNVGKNLINWNFYPFNENRLEVTLNAGTYILSGKSTIVGGNAYIKGQKANGTYCTKAELGFPTWGDSSIPNVYYGGAGDQTFTITIPEDSVRLEFGKLNNDGTVPAQLEKNSVVTDFEPYQGELYTSPLGQTVYGGYDDIVNGNGKSTYKIIDMGDLTYNYNSTDNIFGTSVVSDMADYDTSRIQLACEVFKALTPRSTNIKNENDNCIAFNNAPTKFLRIKCTSYTDDSALKTALTGYKLAYEVNNPTDITHDSTQIETLAGQNNLSTPLSGQSIETNGVEYKELFTWDDVQSLINNDYASSNTTYSSSFIETKFALKYDLPLISSKVVKASGSTSVTFNHERIFSADQTYCELLQYGSGDRVVVSDVSVTTGSVTFTFASATTQSITFRCRISNVLIG